DRPMTAGGVCAGRGAPGGVGGALVPPFTRAGPGLAGWGRWGEHVRGLGAESGPPPRFAAVDVTDAAAVEAWAKDVLAHLGPPDLLINNAAIMVLPAPLWTIPATDFDRLIDVNVKGVANAIRAFVPAMVARKSGVIVKLS